MDDYYRSNPPLLVTRDPDAVSTQRPWRYRQREEAEYQRQKDAQVGTDASKDSSAASVSHVE